MIQNIATRFLQAELDRIEAGLAWIDSAYRPDLAAEYERRKQMVCDLMDAATTNEAALAAVEQRLRDAEMLLDELADAVANDTMRVALTVDVAYLHGLYDRMGHTIADHTYTYALANVERL